MPFLSARPAASDAGLPHVGLPDLLRGVPDDAFARLPAPQRRALGVALLREEAGGIDLDPRAVGTGLTALLGLIGSDGPLMLAVDDVQWLDPASARALGFALRRLDDRLHHPREQRDDVDAVDGQQGIGPSRRSVLDQHEGNLGVAQHDAV